MKYTKAWELLRIVFCLVPLSVGLNASESSLKIGSTKIVIMQGDITKLNDVNAIVNAANDELQHWDGVAGAISKAADLSMTSDQKGQVPSDSKLQRYCDSMSNFSGHATKCPTGKAVITPAFDLKKMGIRKIIHTTGPRGENPDRQQLLHDAYYNSLKVAQENSLKSVAFPAISTKLFKYDINDATPVAFGAVKKFITDNPGAIDTVTFVLFEDQDFAVYEKFKGLLLDNAATDDHASISANKDSLVVDSTSVTAPKSEQTSTSFSAKNFLMGAFGVSVVGFVSWLIYTRFFSHN